MQALDEDICPTKFKTQPLNKCWFHETHARLLFSCSLFLTSYSKKKCKSFSEDLVSSTRNERLTAIPTPTPSSPEHKPKAPIPLR